MTPREAFAVQAKNCAALGSPFMGRLMQLCSDRLERGTPVTNRVLNWPGDPRPSADNVSLRLAGALHALVLRGDPLATLYPPNEVDDDRLWRGILNAIETHEAEILGFLDDAPQTNEVRRSAGLLAAVAWLRPRHPLILSEVGASGGLNLNFDRYAVETPGGPLGAADPVLTLHPDWTGPTPANHPVSVSDRRGADLSPFRMTDPAEVLRLRAYLWPDQPERHKLTEAAIAAGPPPVDKADAADWLENRLAPRPGHHHVLFNTVAWQYFPPDVDARARAHVEAAGAQATEDTPLSWIAIETDGGRGAGIAVRHWPGNQSFALGRMDFHGRWLSWDPPSNHLYE
ncbi:DUF2332 domain-containing protein [Aestuariibius sp. 2305UL40-4]|uniref:DUF2332 domain-containing protein n=1 Tax=Aestuariibius violaceus TaxID=3234132 RepID=UPI00345E98A2